LGLSASDKMRLQNAKTITTEKNKKKKKKEEKFQVAKYFIDLKAIDKRAWGHDLKVTTDLIAAHRKLVGMNEPIDIQLQETIKRASCHHQ